MPYASRRQRRSSFFITYATQEGPKVIRTLGYPGREDEIKTFAESKGYKVLGISRTLPPPADGGFRIHAETVNEVIEFLGIKLPVKFRIGKSKAKRGHAALTPSGGTCYKKGGYWYNLADATALHHEVFLSDAMTAEQASFTIWHELMHCVQAERIIDRQKANGTYTPEHAKRTWHEAYNNGTAYKMKEYEREANKWAEDFSTEMAPAVSRRPRA